MNTIIHKNIEKTEKLLQSINNSDTLDFSKWTKEKAEIKYTKEPPTFPIYNNFIYWCNLGINIGSEQNKLRPIIILKNYKNSPICSVIPLTTKRSHDNLLFHIDLEKIDSTALIEQTRVVSKLRITKPFRKNGNMITISNNDWTKINSQLQNYFKLRPLKNV